MYTTYFNKELSLNDGRRVHKKYCVENPNVHLLQMCCDELGVRSVLEPIKRHPKDFMSHGRLKVELEDSAGRPINTKFGTSKKKFFIAVGEIINA